MNGDFFNPAKELRKLESAIKQYKLILKTTVDSSQQRRVEKKLKELRAYREKLLAIFDVDDLAEGKQEEGSLKIIDESYLSRILARHPEETVIDSEVHELSLYLDYFYTEFLAIFSERKLKLDFQYSLDRDNFHQTYLGITRRLDDYIQEALRIREGAYNKDVELEMRRRNIKVKRNLFIETYRFFKAVQGFGADLREDLAADGLKCLNGDDIISFEFIEEKRYLEGHTVREAIDELLSFTGEVLAFLNIPDFET